MSFTIVRLADQPAYKEQAAAWFHEKWGAPQQEYLSSMDACLAGATVPQWYLALEGSRIIAGWA